MSNKKAGDLFWRYGLAGACIVLPLIIFFVMEATLCVVVPNEKVSEISIAYELRDKVTLARIAGEARQGRPLGAKEGAAPESGNTAAKKIEPDPDMYLWSAYLAGRYSLVVSTGFIFLISILSIIFGAAILVQRGSRRAIIAIGVAACFFAAIASYALFDLKFARVLVVDRILSIADAHLLLSRIKLSWPTAGIVNVIILITNFVGYLASGLVLGALCVLSVRARPVALTADALKQRRNHIRIALVLASAILAISVISTKMLLQWPLSLLIESQAAALKTLTDAILFRWGSLGTLTLVAAFIPAIAAWALDVEAFRAQMPAQVKSQKAKATEADLDFAWLPALGSVVAVLAPLLASPFADALKSLLDNVK